MIQIIKSVNTRDLYLRIEHIQGNKTCWESVCFSDNDYAADPDSRRSASGFVLYVCGVPNS